MLPRFYCPQLQPGLVALDETEAHHLRRVLRIATGAEVELFDGCGSSATAVVREIASKVVRLDVSSLAIATVARPELHVASAVPKGERVDWLVEKLTELGVRRWTPLITDRSAVKPRDSKLDRLRLLVIAACKQCRQNTLLEIEPLTEASQFWSRANTSQRLIADSSGESLSSLSPRGETSGSIIAIGPEGGWTSEELAAAREHGWQAIRLGDTILRIETAAMALASALLWGQVAR